MDQAEITQVDRKSYLPFVPNIPLEVLKNKDPNLTAHLPLPHLQG
jgi:sulfide:quinone oxidoreductase